MKSVMISIRPKWCEKIASGEKTVEVRKNRPKLEPPFKCYIYCTAGATLVRHPDNTTRLDRRWYSLCGRSTGLNMKVIGEFICDRIIEAGWDYIPDRNGEIFGNTLYYLKGCCLSEKEIISYGNGSEMSGYVYGWHISELKIYDTPKTLQGFRRWSDEIPCVGGEFCDHQYFDYSEGTTACSIDFDGADCVKLVLSRPPQSWCYVEELR